MQKDFSYTLKIDDLKQTHQKYFIKADCNQLELLKNILQVEDVQSFEAEVTLKLSRKAHRLDIQGQVQAALVLKSVISLENFTKVYNVPFSYWYDTSLTYQDIKDMEAGIQDDVPDIIENGQIDLVQIAIEQLALALEDYPRKEGEKFEFHSEFDEETSIASHPFAALKKLKK